MRARSVWCVSFQDGVMISRRISVVASAVLRSAAGLFISAGYVFDNMSVAISDWGMGRSSPQTILTEIKRWNNIQNRAARLRRPLIRHKVRPDVVLVHCMDARFNARETLGGRFGSCYDIATPGGIIPDGILEGIKAVVLERGVKLVIFTEHRDCLAKRVVKASNHYHALRSELDHLQENRERFVSDPKIAELISAKKLIVTSAFQDTIGQRLMFIEDHVHLRAA